MPTCAVPTCKNHCRNLKGSRVKYYPFPKDDNKRLEWLINCRRADKVNFLHARVCSDHFTEEDQQRNLQAELLGITSPHIKLKPDAVPSLNLPFCDILASSDEHTSSEKIVDDKGLVKNKRSQACKIRKRALERLRNLSPKRVKVNNETMTDFTLSKCERLQELEKELTWLWPRHQKMQKTILELKAKNLKLEQNILKTREKLAQYKHKFI